MRRLFQSYLITLCFLVLTVWATNLSAPRAAVVKAFRISGTAYQGQNPVKWNDVYQTTFRYVIQESLCSSMTTVLDQLKIPLSECKLSEVKMTTTSPPSVFVSLDVTLNGEYAIDFEQIKSKLEVLAHENPGLTVISGDVSTNPIVPATPSPTITTSAFQIAGVAYQGERPLAWNDVYATTYYYVFQDALCSSMTTVLIQMGIPMKDCKLTEIRKTDYEPLYVYVRLEVLLEGEHMINADQITEEMKALSIRDPDLSVIGDGIQLTPVELTTTAAALTITDNIKITGIAVKGNEFLKWNDDYGNNGSPIFGVIESELCNIVKMALEQENLSYDKCQLIALTRTPQDQVSIELNVTFNGDVQINVQQLTEKLKDLSLEYTHQTGIGGNVEIIAATTTTTTTTTSPTTTPTTTTATTTTATVTTTNTQTETTVTAGNDITTNQITITGIAVKGNELLKWNDDYGNNGSPIFGVIESELCNIVKMALEQENLSYDKCQLLVLTKTEQDEVSVELKVTFNENVQINVQQLTDKLKNLSLEHTHQTGIGGNIEIIDLIFSNSIKIAGIAVKGNDPLKWDDKYGNVEDPIYEITKSQLCTIVSKALEEENKFYDKCTVILEQTPQDQVAVEINVQFKTNVEFNVQQFTERLKELSLDNPQWTGIGGNIEINSSELITASSLQIRGTVVQGKHPVKWKPEYSNNKSFGFYLLSDVLCSSMKLAFITLNSSYGTCILIQLQETDQSTVVAKLEVALKGESLVNIAQLNKELQNIITTNPYITSIGEPVQIIPVDQIIATSLQIKGIAMQGPHPIKWKAEYNDPNSFTYKLLSNVLCSSVKTALLEMKSTYERCNVIALKKTTQSEVDVELKIAFNGETSISIELLKEEMRMILIKYPALTSIGGQFEIIPAVQR